MMEQQPTRRFPRVPVRGTVRALLRRVSESDTLPVTLREVSEGGLCIVMPGAAPDTGARVTVEMALWRQMLYLPANVVWSRTLSGATTCGLKLHLEVTDAATRRAFAGWVRNQAAPDRAAPTASRRDALARPRTTPAPEPPPRPVPSADRPYELDLTEMDTNVTVPEDGTSRAEELFAWLFRR